MRKKTKIWIITAVSFILAGGIVFVGGMSMLKWNFKGIDTTKYETNTYDIVEEFENISINTDTADILFVLSAGGKCKVECVEESKTKHNVLVQEGTLKINIKDTRKWYDYISFFSFGTPKITVYLPLDKYALLTINASTGDIEIPKEITFDSIDIKGSTGDINCKSSVTNDLKIELSTGETILENITAGNIELKASTGDTYLTNVNCNSLSSSADTGYIKLENVDAGKKLSITRSTGDVKFEQCDADEIYINTDTGDVEGRLLTSKIFDCKTDTGEISLPNTTEGGKCEITTDTGDIKIKVKASSHGYFIR